MRIALWWAAPLVIVLLSFAAARSEDVGDRLPPPPEGKTWKLIWGDEFDGTRIDETKWDVRDNVKRKEKGVFLREATTLDDNGYGKLCDSPTATGWIKTGLGSYNPQTGVSKGIAGQVGHLSTHPEELMS